MNNIQYSSSPINRGGPDCVLTTDACPTGWGVIFGNESTNGHFSEEEVEQINILELRAALYALQSFCNEKFDCHILLRMDNTAAVSAVNKQGSTKSVSMDNLAHDVWNWAILRNIWLSATYVPGVLKIRRQGIQETGYQNRIDARS